LATAGAAPAAGARLARARAVAGVALGTAAGTACIVLALAGPAPAQCFAPGSPAGPQPGALAMLERALPETGGWSLESSATRWVGERSLETRALALAAGPAALRVALGLSQTGDPELGWTTLALALASASPEGGFALRALARRDRDVGALGAASLRDPLGLEAGAGAWLAPAPALRLWASAPQLELAGPAPPLVRPLELGARAGSDDVSAWLSLRAPRGGDDGERSAGLMLGFGAASAWAEARDVPLRASFGLCANLRALRLEARADAHPVLGETTRLVLAWRGRGERP
jgi:hypothetical protein